MERRAPIEPPFRPNPMEPMPSPFRPPVPIAGDELARVLKEILDRLNSIETRLKNIENAVKAEPSRRA